MVKVDESYIRDPFNLYGLQQEINFNKEKFRKCLELILSERPPNELELQDQQFLELNQDASDLYGLIHARFINTSAGMAKVHQKFLEGLYGQCPRGLCDRQKVLPVGMSDTLKISRFKLYCPRCREVYVPKFKTVNIDGAYFGTSFPHHFLQHFQDAILLPPKVFFYEP